MIQGSVSQLREVNVDLQVADKGGAYTIVSFLIDTGFNGEITLPQNLIAQLQLPSAGIRNAKLADGSFVSLQLYDANIIWHGRARQTKVMESDGDPLVGMALLWGNRLTIEAQPNGNVTIEELP